MLAAGIGPLLQLKILHEAFPCHDLPCMLYYLTDELAVPVDSTDLLRKRAFPVVVLFLHGRQVDVDTRAFTGVQFCVQAVLTKVDGRTIHLVKQYGR